MFKNILKINILLFCVRLSNSFNNIYIVRRLIEKNRYIKNYKKNNLLVNINMFESEDAELINNEEMIESSHLNESSPIDNWLIGMGLKENNTIPVELRLDPITKIKNSGKAGLISYALTEGIFWLISIPIAFSFVTITTGTIPDVKTQEGITILGGYSVAFLTLARTIVPIRIAFALAITPWVDNNIISKFFDNKNKIN